MTRNDRNGNQWSTSLDPYVLGRCEHEVMTLDKNEIKQGYFDGDFSEEESITLLKAHHGISEKEAEDFLFEDWRRDN